MSPNVKKTLTIVAVVLGVLFLLGKAPQQVKDVIGY